MTPQETEQDLTVNVWGSPAEAWVSSSLPWGWGTGGSTPGRDVLAQVLFEVTESLLYKFIDSRTGSHQVKQLVGRENSPTHQQTTGLKFY